MNSKVVVIPVKKPVEARFPCTRRPRFVREMRGVNCPVPVAVDSACFVVG